MHVIDSHTEGEPTRVVMDGGPDLGGGPISERLDRFGNEHDEFRRRVILEPRGSDELVGALLCEPTRDDCTTAVIFFNNAGYLGMCGHATIGLAVTLAYLGRVDAGEMLFETPVGVVKVNLESPNEATFENVVSYCERLDVAVDVPGLGEVRGDIAWGGNWFFLIDDAPRPLTLANTAELIQISSQIKDALDTNEIRGRGGAAIDHIEFFAPATDADSRNFVLCPGNAYDRSPCGTGTSAKLACLAERGKLEPGTNWVQESVIGSRFTASYRDNDGEGIVPIITGRAYICGEGTLVSQPGDPFADGIV